MEDYLIDNEEYFKKLRARPYVAWPTVVLILVVVSTVIWSWISVLTHTIPLWVGTLVNCVCYYFVFTCFHEPLHNAVSTNPKINDFFLYLSFSLLSITPWACKAGKFEHMQHHIKCGQEGDEGDPDLPFLAGKNAKHIWFIFPFLSLFNLLKTRENILEFMGPYFKVSFAAFIAIIVYCLYAIPVEFICLYVIPLLVFCWTLAYVFSYLPHRVHKKIPGEEPLGLYQSTANRVGWEWLLTPLMQYQNYHLAHHIYPTVPFYRMRKIWLARKTFHYSNNPTEMKAFSSEPTYY